MYGADQGPPSSPPSSSGSSRSSKVVMQRQYRSKEGECFNILRGIIKNLTGEELQTRHDILTKVIDLLSSPSGTSGQQGVTRVVPSAPYETPASTNVADMTLNHLGYSAQGPSHIHHPQTSHPSGEFGAYSVQSHGQQYYYHTDFASDQDNYQEYDEEFWPGYNHPHP